MPSHTTTDDTPTYLLRHPIYNIIVVINHCLLNFNFDSLPDFTSVRIMSVRLNSKRVSVQNATREVGN